MTRPTVRDRSSIYQYRKRVPIDVLDRARGQPVLVRLPGLNGEPAFTATGTIGDVVKFSLRTRDDEVAKVRVSAADVQLATFYDALRKGPAPLSHKQIVALSGEVYRTLVARFSENPGHPDDWAAVKAFSRAAREGRLVNVPRFDLNTIAETELASQTFGEDLTAGINALPKSLDRRGIEARFGDVTDWVLTLHGLCVDADTRWRLLEQIDHAAIDAAWALKRNAAGD